MGGSPVTAIQRQNPTRAVLRVLLVAWAAVAVRAPLCAADDVAAWKEAFGAADPAAAQEAIDAVVAGKRMESLPALVVAALASTHPHLATEVGDALRVLAAPWSPEIQAALAAPPKNLAARANVARVLSGWGRPEVDGPLAELCEAPSPLREDALVLAGRLEDAQGVSFPKTLRAIETALEDKLPDVRRAAAFAAGRRRAESLAAPLVAMAIADQGRWNSSFAVRAIERAGYRAGVQPFVRALRTQKQADVRMGCLKAISCLATAEDVDALLVLMKGGDLDARYAAVLALGRLADPAAFGVEASPSPLAALPAAAGEAVAHALLDVVGGPGTWSVRFAAVRALTRGRAWSTAHVRKRVEPWFDAKDEDSRLLALRLAAWAGIDDLRLRIETAAMGADFATERSTAARALDVLGPKASATTMLATLRTSRRPDVRRRAAQVLGHLRDVDVVRALVDELDRSGVAAADADADLDALERLTGHRFGPLAAPWRTWLASTTAVLTPPPPRVDRRAARTAAARTTGFRPECDAAIERALDWLARTQRVDGSWKSREDGWGGSVGQEATYAGLCVAAFTGAGYGATTGRYRECVYRAAEFLASTQEFDGRNSAYELDRSWGPAESHLRGMGVYAGPSGIWGLVDAHLADRDPRWLGPAQRAIDRLGDVQVRGSGWGRVHTEPAFVSESALYLCAVSPWVAEGRFGDPWTLDGVLVLFAYQSVGIGDATEKPGNVAADPGFSVGEEHAPAMYYVDDVVPGTAGQRHASVPTITVTEFGLLGRLLMGLPRSHPAEVGGAVYVRDARPRGMEPPPTNRANWVHARAWAGAMAMFQMGGNYWRTWYDAIAREYPTAQVVAPPEVYGSFESLRAYDDMGRVFSTAFCALTLEAPYHFPMRPPR